jgi:hypothetical protein
MTIGIRPPVQYHQGRDKAGVNYHAGELLESMRESVETVLQICAVRYREMPTCSSQSFRARDARDLIIADRVKSFSSIKFIRILSDFLAVHRTVSLLEQKTK